ncbi:RimJ/RimL family protein N-acetyltransferase [Allocatelliglobosispora scoriae]|uniref:RimJ/RimL family protein N-acetyltransferase n=1 Tax=Allocatelliglobosispora scoriae TaxID=643052 RepID=A0A841C0J3_9ACTN|nr:GNAT family N-acetyltransferase [Allocatelliglobosispora scoriae]MBB5873894.1 RimJ/RimL family protein N-acetyltransferase [Allocatelliglobosispora scoriae]
MSLWETDRLIIRDWTEEPADVERIFDMLSRWEVARWLGATPRALTDPAEAVGVVRRWRARGSADGRFGIWAIEVRATGEAVGTVLVIPMPGMGGATTEDIEVGWHLHPDAWGNGYATEAARSAVDRAFAAGVPEIFAVVRPGNAPSVAVTRRLGMSPLGPQPDRWYDGAELEAFVLTAPSA